jgi:MoxR-like ATPase
MPDRAYPSKEGLRTVLKQLQDHPVGRAVSHLPVLLAVESALEAGEGNLVPGPGGLQAVPNEALHARLVRWFGVEGPGSHPYYFIPFPLPGGKARHWRGRGIVAQNTMSRAINTGWVLNAIHGAYPLADLAGWRETVAGDMGDQSKDAPARHGVDLAALAMWLCRSQGMDPASDPPSREDLIAAALEQLGLPADHSLLTTVPPVLDTAGPYTPETERFQENALTEEEILALAMESAPWAAVGVGVEPDEPPPPQVVRTVLVPPDPPLELDDRVRRMLRISIAVSKAIMLVGPPGTGKTSLVAEVQAELAQPGGPERYGLTKAPAGIKPVTPDDDWNAQTLIGGLTLDENNNLRFRPGFVLEAIRSGEWLLLDEANRGDLDKIFGALLTWLSGQSVVIGRASTDPDAPSVVLDWADSPDCEVVGYERLARSEEEALEGPEPTPEATAGGVSDHDATLPDAGSQAPPTTAEASPADAPIVFRAGTDWRLIGTYNPVDAQRVFHLGQALGRRFKRVPMPPIDNAQFAKALAAQYPALPANVATAIRRLYNIHSTLSPPLGPAPFLDIAGYVLAAIPGAAADPNSVDAEAMTTTAQTEEPAGGDSGQTQAIETASSVVEQLLAEGYLASLGSWLPLLDDEDFDRLRKDVGETLLSPKSWQWIKKMRSAL